MALDLFDCVRFFSEGSNPKVLKVLLRWNIGTIQGLTGNEVRNPVPFSGKEILRFLPFSYR
jgi:hypothetical protein